MRPQLAAVMALICVSCAGVLLVAWTPTMPSLCTMHPALCRKAPAVPSRSVPYSRLRAVQQPVDTLRTDAPKEEHVDWPPDASTSVGGIQEVEQDSGDRRRDAASLSPAPPGIGTALKPEETKLPTFPRSSSAHVWGNSRRRALIFTMDSIKSYVQNSQRGGPAGEILVRKSLEEGLRQLGIEPIVAENDAQFHQLSANPDSFQYFFLDPWTFVGKGVCVYLQ